MSGLLRLPFLDAAPWRVAVISPTGRYARNQVAGMVAAGTPLVGGIALGRGGTDMDGLPLYDRIDDLPQKPNIAVIYTPAEGVRAAIAEWCGRRFRPLWRLPNMCRCTTRSLRSRSPAKQGAGSSARIRWGYSCRGGDCSAPSRQAFARKGVSPSCASGTVALALTRQLTLAGIGQRIVAHIGGDSVIGRNPHEYLLALANDDATAAVLYCGEIGGDKEYALAEAARGFPKPVIAMVVGRHAPVQKQMGHAGALIGSARESAEAKMQALAAAGCQVAKGLEEAIAMAAKLGLAVS